MPKPETQRSPPPGTYDTEKAFEKVASRSPNFKIDKSPTRGFIDFAIKKKKFLPGIGHYKIKDTTYNLLTKGPSTIGKKRH